MPRSAPNATDIAQHLLDVTGDCLLSGDFERFASCFSLPHPIDTFDTAFVVETLDDLRVCFDQMRAYFASRGVTDVVRHVIEASFLDDTTLRFSHQTRILSGLTLVQTPYPCMSVVKLNEGAWRVASSQYAISDSPEQNMALAGAQTSSPNGAIYD